MVKRSVLEPSTQKKRGKEIKQHEIQVSTGLPPQVDGQLRCFCKLSISQIAWIIAKPPDLAFVRVKWWGEEGGGTLFRPVDVRKGKNAEFHTTARYPVRSGPFQFATYLNDMGTLALDLLKGPHSDVLGQASVSDIGSLSNSKSINGFFPVVSAAGQKLANLQVSLVLEPLMASYDCNGSIPTSDINTSAVQNHDNFLMAEASRPFQHYELPEKPKSSITVSPAALHGKTATQSHAHATQQQLIYGLQNGHVARSPTSMHTAGSTVAITANGDVVNIPGGEIKDVHSVMSGINQLVNANNNSQLKNNDAQEGSDLLSLLVDRGKKLRDAMIVSSMHTDNDPKHMQALVGKEESVNAAAASPPRRSRGSQPALLMSHQTLSPTNAFSFLPDSPVKTTDFQLYKLMNGASPGTSLSSDMCYDHIFSDLEDPMHENSILQDLFYYHSDNEAVGMGDLSLLQNQSWRQNGTMKTVEKVPTLPVALLKPAPAGPTSIDDPGNQRPPSRASSIASLTFPDEDEEDEDIRKKKKIKRKARSRSRSRSTSKSRSRSNTPSRPSQSKSRKEEEKENSSLLSKDSSISKSGGKVKSKLKSRSRSSSRSRARSRKKKTDPECKDQHETSTRVAGLETSKPHSDDGKTVIDGLSVERLTLLGRVHVARVNVIQLQLNKADVLETSGTKSSAGRLKGGRPPKPLKNKKPCTYFVEYQFPVTASSRDKYTSSAMATEVTRVASKNFKDGAVIFSHRSMFPLMFDSSAIEHWWKTALVFRLYAREAGQNSPSLVGSGGVSLKSILRAESLSIQREVEIPDANSHGTMNTSRSSFNSSISSRTGSVIFGHLKISVELASDHKDFATMLARTKLTEMSGKVRVVPIGGVSPNKARLVDQLNKNKDSNQPIVKSPVKNIDLPFMGPLEPVTGKGEQGIIGLPPQSPRRKNSDASCQKALEETDEIGKLKQQLKATLATLSNQKSDPAQSKSQHKLDTGVEMASRSHFEPATLHTLLYIQEGTNISVNGVPPLHMANKNPNLLQPRPSSADGRNAAVRNTYLVCRMFWCNDAVHSSVAWGTLNPEFNFLQVAPVLMTPSLLERLRDNYMIVEVWDKKVTAESDQLIGMVKLSLHQFYLSFRNQKICNALLRSEYPVMAIDNYMPIIDLFTGLYFGQLKVILAMGSEQQILTLQHLALGTRVDRLPGQPSVFLERQDLINEQQSQTSSAEVEHQFEVVIDGIRGLKLFENMIWGEADCFVQFFFPCEGDVKDDNRKTTIKTLPTMKCFRTATTLCIPDPTFHDTSRHRFRLPAGTPVQRELLTACANSRDGVNGLPFEVWCRYYHPNVRDQLIAKSTLPLAKLCAMVTMHKRGEPCVQSFPLRMTQLNLDGQSCPEQAAKGRDAGIMDVTVHYKSQASQINAISDAVNRNHNGSQVCLTVGVIRATGLKAAADAIAQLDSSMAYPADVGVNAYVRIKLSFLGKENERITKTVARCFTPEFSHYMDFPCSLLVSECVSADSTSLAELIETAEAEFEVWHQMPATLNRDPRMNVANDQFAMRSRVHPAGDILLGTCIVPLMPLLTRRTGLNGWYAINLPTMGWVKTTEEGQAMSGSALDQVVGGLELCLRFSNQDDRDRVITVARSVGWSPLDMELEQPDWQDQESHHTVHNITISVDLVSIPPTSALLTGQSQVDPNTRCYIRYKMYDKGAVVSKVRKVHLSDTGSLVCSLNHKHSFVLSHTAPLQWYLREERLEIQAWITYNHNKDGEKRPRQRDKLIGSCLIDLDSLTNMNRKQQRISGLYPLFKSASPTLKSSFIRAHVLSKVTSSPNDQASDFDLSMREADQSISISDTDQSVDSLHHLVDGINMNKSSKKKMKNKVDGDLEASFGVLLSVERAMHLPKVSENNRSCEICPSSYISYQSAERSKQSCSKIFPNSCNPVWDYAVETRLSLEYLTTANKNLVLKVWHKPSDASKSPVASAQETDARVTKKTQTSLLAEERVWFLHNYNPCMDQLAEHDKSSDRVLGFVSVDLSPLTKGLQQICGWYNILDFTGQCRGQIKVSITPQDLTMTPGLIAASPSTSFMFPSLPVPGSMAGTQSVASTIAQQLLSLQQQVMLKMGSLSTHVQEPPAFTARSQELDTSEELNFKDAAFSSANTTEQSNLTLPTTNMYWPSVPSTMGRTDDSSKSFLFSTLRRQLADLDSITKGMKARLSHDEELHPAPVNSARSGDILTGTHSGLSTIHNASSLTNTRGSSALSRYNNASSFEVGTSQESARSQKLNISSPVENTVETVEPAINSIGNHQKFLDSGIFSSTKPGSERSGEDAPDSQRSEKNIMMVTTSDNMSTLPSVFNDSLPVPAVTPAVAGTLEAGFLNEAAVKTQTLFPIVDNSESSQNSHGFDPATQRSVLTAQSDSQSTRGLEHMRIGYKDVDSNDGGSSGGIKVGSKNSHSNSAAGSTKSEKTSTLELLAEDDKEAEEYESDTEEEEVGEGKKYGSYRRYRDLLDAEEDADEEEGNDDEGADIVEIIPRSLNNMSSVIALGDENHVVTTPQKDQSRGNYFLEQAGVDGILRDLSLTPASPGTNLHEGTSVWCSDDNEDSFFQQVFEKNQKILAESGDVADKIALEECQPEREEDEPAMMSHLENWLVSHSNGHMSHSLQKRDGDEFEGYGLLQDIDSNAEALQGEANTSGYAVTPRPGFEIEGDIRLNLSNGLDHETEDDKEGKAGVVNVWNQDVLNSSEEEEEDETPRNLLDEGHDSHENDFFDSDPEEATVRSKFENLHLGANGDDLQESTREGRSNSPDQAISLLSNVELIDTLLTTSAQPTGQTYGRCLEETTLTSNIMSGQNYPYTLELDKTKTAHLSDSMGQGARPKIRHLLSNVDLASETSSQRPNSGSSHGSRASGNSRKSKTSSRSKSSSKSFVALEKSSSGSSKSAHSSNRSTLEMRENNLNDDDQRAALDQAKRVSDKTGRARVNNNSNHDVIDNAVNTDVHSDDHEIQDNDLTPCDISREEDQANLNKVNTLPPPFMGAALKDQHSHHNDRNSTMDSAYVDGDPNETQATHPHSLLMQNDRHLSEDLTPEDSGVGHGAMDPYNSQLTHDHSGMDIPNGVRPDCFANFFMNPEEMQSSIKALQMATAAANKITQNDVKSQNKVKAVSDLVRKLATSKPKQGRVSVKNKPPPSAEEAKRIAKIFSSKLS